MWETKSVAYTRTEWGSVVRMMVAELVSTQRMVNALSVRDLAALSRVAPSTISRIESGELDPTASVLERVLASLGLTLAQRMNADSGASAAARVACDMDYSGERPESVVGFLDGWERIRLVRDGRAVPGRESDLLFRASRLDRLTKRAGVEYLPKRDWEQIADRFAGVPSLRWALTGGAAANQLVNVGGDQPQQFYVSDIGLAADVGELDLVPAGYRGPRVMLLPFNGIHESGRTQDVNGLWLADRWQIAIDCLSGSVAGDAQARALVGRQG